jgi:hypothetical protein
VQQDKHTPLLAASCSGKLLAVKLLIERGADLKATTGRGNSALSLAMMDANVALVQLLVANGADVNTVNEARASSATTRRCAHCITDTLRIRLTLFFSRVLLLPRRSQEGKSPSAVAGASLKIKPSDAAAVAAAKAQIAAARAALKTPYAPLALATSLRKPLTSWDFFLSHYQLNGGPQMGQLCAELKLVGKTAWYDKSETPSVEGMMNGVANSAAFLLFLTRDVFTREFCLLEIREALRLRKPVILLRETEPRLTFRAADGETKATTATISEHIAAATEKELQHLFTNLVALEHRQEAHEREAMIKELCRPGKAAVVPQ